MKILIIVQKLDKHDDFFGFFHGRLADFAEACDEVYVICLEARSHDLPANVTVHSLGKEKEGGHSRVDYLVNFYKTLWGLRGKYDSVFVYLEPIFVVLGGILWRITGKRVALWYNHTHMSLTLRVAAFLSHAVLAPSRDRFPFATRKLVVLPGRTDLESFLCHVPPHAAKP
ncbi:hypothetical protein L0Y49_03680 [bacterium]|nr:hypothetical protein [bacterium]MCI0679803.1 hypothetical protein [bacterium]